MSDPTCLMGAHNIRPQQCLACESQTPHFSFETAISDPSNVSPQPFRARLQSQAPTMSDPTLIARDYNFRPQQCQTPHLSRETTISGPDNVRLYTFLSRLQYQAPTMSDHTLFVRVYNLRPRQCQTPHNNNNNNNLLVFPYKDGIT